MQLEWEGHVRERGAVGLGVVGRCWGVLWVRHLLLGPCKGFKPRGDYLAFFPRVRLLEGRRSVQTSWTKIRSLVMTCPGRKREDGFHLRSYH